MGLFPVKTLLTENTLKFEFGEFQPRVPNCDVVSIVISGSTILGTTVLLITHGNA